MTQKKILIIEDEGDIRALVALHAKREGYAVDEAESAQQALERLAQGRYDLLVMDWMLPGLSGVDLTRRLRREGVDVPILMLTARKENADVVAGLESGADDYVTKPFEPSVLNARLRALLRRSHEAAPNDSVLRVRNLAVFVERHRVEVNGQEVHLTAGEYKLMLALLQNRGRVLTRDKLIRLVHGDGISVVGRAIDTMLFGLRKKLGSDGDIVETVRGVGYRIS